ncbi:Uncharacterized protein OS=Singulisphaera acidiphila (strain ATCC BAA-1392 / DSM 18658 / VKM B-2454 / MOB10) GN=Sinac_6598 PE=4 SV=1 [Gemmata massiliana]|uniref:Carboxypeptidase regulatory-like domain-containing protein n=1 Tax=Gemmata massiliana TaxID=1210884 RepID=A0A6P2D0T1_9BACT|nr:carboxypeptidase regulatory-like domain-containing protein [Gemmata massiliana]VTR94437.1 Uncharacterized protein OS=Singulisphaera acidiphila (strain ATCC BAA-1392 / DSM 18658 / VKM B-2454 / MOB10) GN=Sinac_6598 PE=4 SV=1 [Gemmata massiliana]
MRGLILAAAITGLSVGCGGEVRSPLGERAIVKGKVTISGQPVTRGTVVYTPTEDNKADEQTGQIQSGEYTTSVFPGKYKVSVTGNGSVPAKYKSAQSSDVTIDVPKGGKTDADIDLK